MKKSFVTSPLAIMILVLMSMCFFPADGFANMPRVRLVDDWKPGMVVQKWEVEQAGIARCFVSEKINDQVWNRMKGKSWNVGCPVSRDGLRYLRLLHYNAKGEIQTGEMVVNKQIADRVVSISANYTSRNTA